MRELTYQQHIQVYDRADELPAELRSLLQKAHEATQTAYAPYSNFKVGAAVLLENGRVVIGSNQENASYPAGCCAERVAIMSASAQYPNVKMKALAIAIKAETLTTTPVAPCGICRQTILEYEMAYRQNIQLILQGETGEIYRIDSAKTLLPLYFSQDDLK